MIPIAPTARKLWLTTDIPAPNSPAKVKYLDVALAASSAIDRDKDKARTGFDAAMRKYGGDPIQQDIAFMRGRASSSAWVMRAAAAKAFAKARRSSSRPERARTSGWREPRS